MALLLKTMAAAFIDGTSEDVYSPSINQAKNVLLKNIILTNIDSVSQNASISLLIGGTEYPLQKSTAVSPYGQLAFTKEVTLDLNNSTAKIIRIMSTNAGKFHCVINGLEKDVSA